MIKWFYPRSIVYLGMLFTLARITVVNKQIIGVYKDDDFGTEKIFTETEFKYHEYYGNIERR